MRSAAFERIAVVGCGLIGGSFAVASQQVTGVTDVVVWDRDEASRKRAATLGVGTRVASDIADAVGGAQLVLLGVPAPDLADVARRVAPHLAPGALVTDVASVKTGAV
ncbi:MAG: cyclohexadieny/prephenate dehydrogenase, partial [Glaciecola sp.]